MYSHQTCLKITTFVVFFASILFESGESYMVGNNPYNLRENIDPQGRYQVEWLVDWRNKIITFNVTVQTTGYVGFGLNSAGRMAGADMVIGGVDWRRRAYFGDFHGVGEQAPQRDLSQDWNLLSATENLTHTMLSFSRAFDTCDEQDYQITEDHVAIIWAFGETDEVRYHEANRGVFHAYLLNPDYSPQIITEPGTGMQRVLDANGNIDPSINVWTIPIEMNVTTVETVYWCTMHRTPRLSRPNHQIGFNVRLHGESSLRHVHHLAVTRCNAPRGGSQTAAQMFDSFVGGAGENCFTAGVQTQTETIPMQYCSDFHQLWAAGGRPHFYPPHVGFSFSGGEYYIVQVHINNPDLVANNRVSFSVDFFYTENVRPNEGGVVSVRHEIPGLSPSFLIPPNTVNHQIRGICGSQCTRQMFPPEGISVYGALLHTHNTGRRLRVRHFRNNRELPFIAADENYFGLYQQVRMLPQEIRVLPGDQLVMECVFDTTEANGTVVGGFATSQEMCVAGLLHYQRLTDIIYCDSQITTAADRQYFLAGVENMTWSLRPLDFVVDPPHRLAGLSITEVSNYHVEWSAERRAEFERYHSYRPHMNRCLRELWTLGPNGVPSTDPGVSVSFPYGIKPYERERTCQVGGRKRGKFRQGYSRYH